MLGALVPYLSLPSGLAGRDVIHWIDNTSAKAALVHGYSGLPDSARLAHIFHAWNMSLAARVWFEYVPSAANPGDEPSRVDLSGLRFVVCRHPEIISDPTPVVFPRRWRGGATRRAGHAKRASCGGCSGRPPRGRQEPGTTRTDPEHSCSGLSTSSRAEAERGRSAR